MIEAGTHSTVQAVDINSIRMCPLVGARALVEIDAYRERPQFDVGWPEVLHGGIALAGAVGERAGLAEVVTGDIRAADSSGEFGGVKVTHAEHLSRASV